MFNNFEIIKRRQKWIKKELAEIKVLEKNFPQDELICGKNANHYKWYIKNDNKKTYLPKDKIELAEQLAIKKYYSNRKQDLLCEMAAGEAYMRKINTRKNTAEDILKHPEYARLLERHFVSKNKELEKWQNEDYEKNEMHKEHLIVKGTQGKMVRSKSEAIIDKMLYTAEVPFRYEEKLVLGNAVIYPDFVIRHPKTGRYYYWEHFGMMDDATYIKNTCEKIRLYSENGIIPTINLIMTFETKDNPLNINEVEQIIEKYFIE